MITPVIYIVEDSPFVQDMVEFTLKLESECEVRKFSGVDDVLKALDKRQPDIMILDYDLDRDHFQAPNGLDMLRHLTRLKLKIPTIVLSGQNDKSLAVKMIKQGAIDYVSKNEDTFLDQLTASYHRVLQLLQLNAELKDRQSQQFKVLKNAVLILGAVVCVLGAFLFMNSYH